MNLPSQDLIFKLKSIGVRVEGDDAHIDTDTLQAILKGKQLPHPREVILRDEEAQATAPKPSRRAPRRRPPSSPLRPNRPRTVIRKVDSKIESIPTREKEEPKTAPEVKEAPPAAADGEDRRQGRGAEEGSRRDHGKAAATSRPRKSRPPKPRPKLRPRPRRRPRSRPPRRPRRRRRPRTRSRPRRRPRRRKSRPRPRRRRPSGPRRSAPPAPRTTRTWRPSAARSKRTSWRRRSPVRRPPRRPSRAAPSGARSARRSGWRERSSHSRKRCRRAL